MSNSREREVLKESDTNQPSLTSMLLVQKYGVNHHKQQTLVKSIALNLVVDCSMPFSIVESLGFIRFMEDLDKHYDKVSR
jgi:hypothetical protein